MSTDVSIPSLQERRGMLLEELRELEERIHGGLRRDTHANIDAIEELEKRVTKIVLELTQIERAQIEYNISEMA